MNNMTRPSIFAFQNDRPNIFHMHQSRSGATSSGNWTKAIVGWYYSSWMRLLESRLNDLTSLPQGWNGYRSLPVSFSCAGFAASLLERICTDGLPPPSLVPGADGTLQIEWHRNGYDVEIDVLGPNHVVATRCNIRDDSEETLLLENDFTPLVEWMTDLVRPEEAIAQAAG